MRRRLWIGAAMMLALPSAAFAEPKGYAVCLVVFPSKNRMIFTDPLPAENVGLPAMKTAFIKNMQERIYPGEPDLTSFGDCHFERSQPKAQAHLERVKAGITMAGMTAMGMTYTPKPN